MAMSFLSLAHQVAPRIFSIGKGTWIAVGIGILVLIALIIWAGISALSWLSGQAPAAAETGKRLASVVLGQVEQAIPGVREKIEQVIPEVKNQLEDAVPGVKERVGIWLPDPAEKEAAPRNVSGTDVGPVSRVPGLARENFQRDERGMTVGYARRADVQHVLNHYALGFGAAGYRQAVISATRDAEHHRYTKGEDLVELRVTGKPSGKIEVEIKHSL
jgi:hypothetical protein